MTVSLGYNAVDTHETEEAILDVLHSGQYSPKKRCQEFQETFAKIHKAKYGLFLNSGTDALRCSLAAMKEKYQWPDGSEVAVPAITFVATVNVILQTGLKPFFVDVNLYDFTLNPANLERRIQTSHASLVAIIPVHLFGKSCDKQIFVLAKKYKLKVLEDSCETILNPLRGDVSCYSTYMAHHVTTGVGGLAITSDGDLEDLIWSYANHGRREPREFIFDRIGYSARATEFEAVLGLSQLKRLKDNVEARRYNAEVLTGLLQGFDDLKLPVLTEGHTFMAYPIVLRQDARVRRSDLIIALAKAGVETRVMFPITNQPCYRNLVREDDFPVAEWVNRNGFYLPCHPGVGPQDIEAIVDVFKKALR